MGAIRPKDSAIKDAAIHQYKTGVLSRSCIIQEFYGTPSPLLIHVGVALHI